MSKQSQSAVLESLEARQLFSTIAVLYNAAYVNTATGSDGQDLLQQLQSYGTYTVKTFTGIDSTSLATALSGTNLLVIPALDKGDLNAAMTNGAKGVIRTFLSDGGGLLMVGNPSDHETAFLSNVFDYAVIPDDAVQANYFPQAGATGTKFASGPTSLSNNTTVFPLGASNVALPTGTNVVYANPNHDFYSNNECAVVALLPYANKTPIGYLGYDWTNGGPNGTQDGGWNNLLNVAIEQLSGNVATPAPSSLVATALNQTTINLSWKGSTTNVTGFTIQQGKTAKGPWTTIGTTTVGVTTFAATKLTASTPYYYQVNATGPLGPSSYDTLSTPTTTFSTVFATLTSGKLVITGTNDNDSINLTLSGSTLTVTETNNGAALKTTFSNSLVKSITITDTTGSNDIGVGAGIIAATITTGAGNDVFGLLNTAADSVNGGGGNDILFGTIKDVVKNVKTIVT